MRLDIKALQGKLQDIDPTVKVRLDRRQDVATSIKETDSGSIITFNPARFRSPKKLEEHLNWCKEQIS
jgi:hypothetical protein